MVVPLTLCRSVADTVSTEAAATDTWTFSVTLPTDMAKSIGSSAPTVSVMPLFVWVLNPSKVTVTSYGPGSRLGTLYSPSALVTTWVTTPVATLLIDTLAYGSVAPL